MTARPRILYIGRQALIAAGIALAFAFCVGWITQTVLWGSP